MNRKILGVFVMLFLVALGLRGLLHKNTGTILPPATPAEALNQEPQKAAPSDPRAPSAVTSTPEPARARIRADSSASEEMMRYVENVKADPQYDWKQPMNFYGKVVEESNGPLAGASARCTWTDLSDKGTSAADTVSDGEGLFSLLKRTGKRLSVTVTKQGYYTPRSESLRSFEYAKPGDGLFTPDAADPVIFHLRKRGQGENIIHGSKLFGSRVDGTQSYVDLVEARNQLTPPGDLTVRCTRFESNAEKKFDWTFTLGVPDGGLIESTNEFDLVAPDAGYQPTCQITHRASDGDWTRQEKHRFFVKSLGGRHYARIEITIIADYDQNAAYDVNWFLNPRGSRNLEPMEASPQGPALPPWAPPGAKAVIPDFK